MSRVAILVVTYNSEEEIGGCIDAAVAFSGAEIVVVDNASADATCAIVEERASRFSTRQIRLLRNQNNAGFATAVNQGVRASDAELLILLNPDAHLISPIHPLLSEMDDPGVGAAGGQLVGPDGSAQRGFTVRRLPTVTALSFEVLGINRLLPRNPANWHYRCCDLNLALTIDVEQPAGAFLLFRRAAWGAVGGFDESFWPIWFEDVDFCARLLRAGFRVRYVPESRARHKGAHSIRSLAPERRERYWYGSLLRYAAKHYPSLMFRWMCVAVAVGSTVRIPRDVLRRGRSSFAVSSAVFRLAMGRLFGPVR